MPTTIRLNQRLLMEAKRRAAETGRTLTAVIEDALRESLTRRRVRSARRVPTLKTVGGDGLQPGVDLDDSAALLDSVEDRSR